ncbi:MAG: hypothetical protein HYV29_14740 [Ignavibacteriales bacterium]|nr:hypothetical protein [Ignavibacteriales bacterium]
MNDPTIQELMEYVDGTLEQSRYREVESMIARSKNLRKEIEMLGAMRTVVHSERFSPSKKFTAEIMNEIMPQQNESFWFRLVKNSSNVFAMGVVLTLIAIVLVSSSPSSSATANQLSTAFNTFSDGYNAAFSRIASFVQEYTRPIDGIMKTSFAKILFIGLFIFALYAVIDEIFGKRMMIRR